MRKREDSECPVKDSSRSELIGVEEKWRHRKLDEMNRPKHSKVVRTPGVADCGSPRKKMEEARGRCKTWWRRWS